MKLIRVVPAVMAILFCSPKFAVGQAHPDFSGTWQQVNQRCEPKPKNSAYVYRMAIAQRGSILTVDISVSGTKEPGDLHLVYDIGGKELVYTGLDHDEFHVSANWDGDKLTFQIVEHEDGHENKATEVWALIDGGHTLKRVKQDGEDGRRSRIYILEKS